MAAGAGVNVGLSSSNVGISYQMWNGGTMEGSAMAGTGLALNFGAQTAAGVYTIVATNTATGCTNAMSGNAPVIINSLPATYPVTGGGNYCAGAAGVPVGLGGSTSGVNYQLYNGVTPVGSPVTGSGIGISFGMQTAAGTYTVMAINTSTGCSNTMAGSVPVGINSLPSPYAVTGGGNYCSQKQYWSALVNLGGSNSGISYQLYNGAAPAGAAMAGSGSDINFGMHTAAGTYTVVATNSSTGCTATMSGSATVGLNALH